MRSTETLTFDFGAVSGTGAVSDAFMRSPATKAIVYPVHAQEPVFWNCHVFVNLLPRGTFVPSAMVKSWRRTAESLQPGCPVAETLVGDMVLAVAGGFRKGVFVGGRVEVTNRIGVGLDSTGEMVIHALIANPAINAVRRNRCTV